MLQQLTIRNYAIIDEVVIDFNKGLNIITGETGAGKSILVGALSLILGERVESNILLNKERKCIIEGSFRVIGINDPEELRSLFLENDLEWEDTLVIRREIAINGKSRAFVNDTPVNLGELKKIASFLVSLHQQFDTIEMGNLDFQRKVLDAVAGNDALLKQYKTAYYSYCQLIRDLKELQKLQQEQQAQFDYNSFLFNELDEAAFRENELEELDAELSLLNNSENIRLQIGAVQETLEGGEQPLVQQLKSMVNKLQSIRDFHPAINELADRLQAAQVELKDVASELERVTDKIQFDPERIQWINDRISTGYRLFKKHQVNSTNELIVIRETLSVKLEQVAGASELIARKEKETATLLEQCNSMAAILSGNRMKVKDAFSENVTRLLKQVGMPNACMKIHLEKSALGENGSDHIEFLFNANLPGGKASSQSVFEPLRKVASGGELSRLMLCIKSLVAKQLQLPTLIFDEIDTGISGEAARQVGMIMKELSGLHQLIAITHQPQIAAKADAHFFVYKSIRNDSVHTSIRLLGEDERITIIAQMLSGEKPTAAALQNAREMVGN